MAEHYEPLTPVGIERGMANAVSFIKKGTKVVRDSREDYFAKKRKYKLAAAQARQDDNGSRVDREDRALISTADLWEAMDTAEVAMKYAEDKKSDLEKELMALQTDAKLVLQAYNVAGRGEH